MVYARRRSTYRRKGRRGNRNLTTRRIFNNKSAKAQAKQIYGLTKSIRSLRKQCAPEVKVRRGNIVNDIIGLNNIYVGQTVSNLKYYGAPFPTAGTGDDQRIGNVIKLLPLKVNFSSQYKKIINSVSTPIATKLLGTSGGVRLIAVQSKVATNEVPTISDLLLYTPTSVSDSVGILNSPFVNGITAKYNILYNKVIYYSENQLIKCRNIKIYPKMKTARWEQDQTYPSGYIWFFMVAGGFTFVDVGSGDNPYDYDVCDYAVKFEQPYTDA